MKSMSWMKVFVSVLSVGLLPSTAAIQTLARELPKVYDASVPRERQTALAMSAAPPEVSLSGHPKTGQWWSGQNRPTGGGRGLSCFILPPPVVASLFSYANSGDHI